MNQLREDARVTDEEQPNSIPLAATSPFSSLSKAHKELLAVITGDSTVKHLEDAPPYAKWYFQFLESKFDLVSDGIGVGASVDVPQIQKKINFYQLLTTTARNLNDSNPSLQHIAKEVLENTVPREMPRRIEPIISMSRLVFFAIGWITMLYEPDIAKSNGSEDERQVSIVPAAGSDVFRRTKNSLDDLANLPCHLVLKNFGDQILPCPWLRVRLSTATFPREDIFQEYLVTNYMNFQTLSKVARIKLEFVSSLSLHLEFEEESRKLKLFRFPSWCWFVICSDKVNAKNDPGGSPYLSACLKEYFKSESHENKLQDPDLRRHRLANVCREVLLSYRLIFGQYRRAPYIFRWEYSKVLQDMESDGNPADPLLKQVCETFWKKLPVYAEIGAAPAKRQYLAAKEFPFFQDRLVKVQRYVADQDPSDLITLLHDRRDTLRFWTFWSVVVVGGLSVILSIIQCILAGLQLRSECG